MQNVSLIICLTALNYVSSICDPNLENHIVLSDNDEVKNWILANKHPKLLKCYMLNFQKYSNPKNLFDSTDNTVFSEINTAYSIDRSYSSVASGWVYFFLNRKLKLRNIHKVIIDDGIGNLIKIKSKNYFPSVIISNVCGAPNSFTKYRDFYSNNCDELLTSYTPYLNTNIFAPKKIIDIRNRLEIRVKEIIEYNSAYYTSPYGIHMTSDNGVYSSNHDEIVKYNLKIIESLEDKYNIKFFLKTKKTDPLRKTYKKLKVALHDHTINQELMMDNKLKICSCSFNTFALNALNLKLGVHLLIDSAVLFKEYQKEKEIMMKRLINMSDSQDVTYFNSDSIGNMEN